MSSDDRERSLAEEAATWVPPWARATPIEPREAAEPAEPPESAEPPEAIDPVDAADPVDVAESPEVADPVDAANPPEAADPVGVAESPEAVDPADAAEPPGAAEPAGPADPVLPDGPASVGGAEAQAGADEGEDAALPAEATDDGALAGATDAARLAGAEAAAALASGPEVAPREFDTALADAVLPEAAVPPEAAPQDAAPPEPYALIGEAELRGALEAILLVVEQPVSETALAQVLEQPSGRISELLGELAEEYTSTGRGFELRRAAGGWRLYTRPEYARYVERFVLDGQQLRLTQAALETLAVVAYKQPVTRSRISAIRGVNCDGVIRTLVSRGLIEECGTEPDSGAFLYRTTVLFLEKLGLNSVEELPPLAPFLPDDVDEIADAPR